MFALHVQRGRARHSREQRFEDVIKTLHQLPAEEYAGRDELMALSAHDLKVGAAQLQTPVSTSCNWVSYVHHVHDQESKAGRLWGHRGGPLFDGQPLGAAHRTVQPAVCIEASATAIQARLRPAKLDIPSAAAEKRELVEALLLKLYKLA